MADLAFTFHWSPETMGRMRLGELMHWHALAIERVKAANGAD